MNVHRVEDCRFAEGWIDCSCGALVSEPDDPAGDRNARLAAAWNEHRRSHGAPVRSISGTIGARLVPKFSLRSEAITRALR